MLETPKPIPPEAGREAPKIYTPEIKGVELPPIPRLSNEDVRNGTWALLADLDMVANESAPYLSEAEQYQIHSDVAEVYDYLVRRIQGDLTGERGFSLGEHMPSSFFPAVLRLARRFPQFERAIREDPREREGEYVMDSGHYNAFYLAYRRALDNIALGKPISEAERGRFSLLQELPERAKDVEARIDVREPYPTEKGKIIPENIRRGAGELIHAMEEQFDFLPEEVKRDAWYLMEILGDAVEEKESRLSDSEEGRTLFRLTENPDNLHLDAIPERLFDSITRLQIVSPELARAFFGHPAPGTHGIIELTEGGKREKEAENYLAYNPINIAITKSAGRMEFFSASLSERFRYEEITDVADAGDRIAAADAQALAELDTLGRKEKSEGFFRRALKILTTDIGELRARRREGIEQRAIQRMVEQWMEGLEDTQLPSEKAKVVRDIRAKTEELLKGDRYPISDPFLERLAGELSSKVHPQDLPGIPEYEEELFGLFEFLVGREQFGKRQKEVLQRGLFKKIDREQERVGGLKDRAERYFKEGPSNYPRSVITHKEGFVEWSVPYGGRLAWAKMMIELKKCGVQVDLSELKGRLPPLGECVTRDSSMAWAEFAAAIIENGGEPEDIGFKDWEDAEKKIVDYSRTCPAVEALLKIMRARLERGEAPSLQFIEGARKYDPDFAREALGAVARRDPSALSLAWREPETFGGEPVLIIGVKDGDQELLFSSSTIDVVSDALVELVRGGCDIQLERFESWLPHIHKWGKSEERKLEDLLGRLYIEQVKKNLPTMGSDTAKQDIVLMHETLGERYDLHAKLAVEAVAAEVPGLTQSERPFCDTRRYNEQVFYMDVLLQMYDQRQPIERDDDFRAIQAGYLLGRPVQWVRLDDSPHQGEGGRLSSEQSEENLIAKIMSHELRVRQLPILFAEMLKRFPGFQVSEQADEVVQRVVEKYPNNPDVVKGYGEYLLARAERNKKRYPRGVIEVIIMEADKEDKKIQKAAEQFLSFINRERIQMSGDEQRLVGLRCEYAGRIHAARIRNGFEGTGQFTIGLNSEPAIKDSPPIADGLCRGVAAIEEAQIEKGIKYEPYWTYYDRGLSDYAHAFTTAPADVVGRLVRIVCQTAQDRIKRTRSLIEKLIRKK